MSCNVCDPCDPCLTGPSYKDVAALIRGRLNLPTTAKLRIQKAISSGLQVFSERIVMDKRKRPAIFTPLTVARFPTNGILDLSDLIEEERIMLEKLQTGFIYNSDYKTFGPGNVDIDADTITITAHALPEGVLTRFVISIDSDSNTLAQPLSEDTDYYIHVVDVDTIQVYRAKGDAATLVDLTTTGQGTQTITTPTYPNGQPLVMITNPEVAVNRFPLAWMNAATDKFWWLLGTSLYVYKGDGTPITSLVEFAIPHVVELCEFSQNSAIFQLFDEFIDALVEIVRASEAARDNP